jgi:glutamate synthase (NADPH/NADH) small chain
MQDFLEFDRRDRKKRNRKERIYDFSEIYKELKPKQSAMQASRCVQCGIPYCAFGCPLGNFIPHWLKNVADRDLETAFKISNETSPFPEIMGKICPHDKLCEGACTLGVDLDSAVSIGSIEQYITENGFKQGFSLDVDTPKIDKKVAVIGSGPAGLSVATFLMRHGVSVEMYEKEDRAGGLLTYGIPNFKLDKKTVEKRVSMLIDNGMKLHLNNTVGKDILMEDLLSNYDAIFLGIGATKPIYIGLENEKNENCFQAMEFLTTIQKAQFNNTKSSIDSKRKTVIVIGGGDTAMDCVRSAARQGANLVRCLYRRGEGDMPGSRKEFDNAIEEGVSFNFFLSPKSINVKNGKVVSVTMTRTKIENSKLIYLDEEKVIEADIVIFALGFKVENTPFLDKIGVDKDEKGRFKANNYRSTKDKIYLGGDCVRGADLVVRAALDGREATKSILQDLGVEI